MEQRFAKMVAVVTGAASGLGRESARRLANEGAHVVGVDIDEVGLNAVIKELPTQSIAVKADVSSESDVVRYMRAATDAFGKVDFYHLNAGIFGSFTPLPDLDVDDFDKVMNVNLRGQFMGVRAAFRQYRDQDSVGAIVLTASVASLSASADLLAYHTSKHAVVGLVRGSAMYGGPLGIRVNGVAPGIVPTDLFENAASTKGGKNDMTQRASTTPLRRAGTAQEVAGAVSYLLSNDASYVTGHILTVDGGATIVNTVRPSGGAGAWDTETVDQAMYGNTWKKVGTN